MYVKNINQVPEDKELRLSNGAKDHAGNFTWEKKIDVVTKYMALGNFRLVGELCNVPYRTLMEWRKAEWWGELVDEIKKTRQTELNSKLSKIVDKSLATIEDRLENGDFVLNNKTGEVVRKPVSVRDANMVTKDLLNHQIKMEELTNKIETNRETVADQLKLLANEFAKWSRKDSTKRAETITFRELNRAIQRSDQEAGDFVSLEEEQSGETSGNSSEELFEEQSENSGEEFFTRPA